VVFFRGFGSSCGSGFPDGKMFLLVREEGSETEGEKYSADDWPAAIF